MKFGSGTLLALISAGAMACGGDEGANDQRFDPSNEEVDGAFSVRPGLAGDAGTDATTGKGGDAGHREVVDSGRRDDNTCATVSTGVELAPVHLAFAFDVSGSMGNGDKPWHDKALKWDPVVAATKTFFASDGAANMRASLTFFPSDSSRTRCTEGAYDAPDVDMSELPSALFAAAIDQVTPGPGEAWRSATPTLAVLRGTGKYVNGARAKSDGKYAIVLVTDGHPQGCGGDADDVDTVVTEAEKSLANDLPTYVIGVANPPGKDVPQTVTDLHRIAAAGGTEKALIIDTGDPSATASAFSAAIERIRKATISCAVAIPAQQAGAEFDKQSVVVHYQGSTGAHELVYDKTCAQENAWHYDDVANPTQVVLCDQTCDAVRADADAKLEVEFACEQVLVI